MSESTSESDLDSDSDESDCVEVIAVGDDPLPEVLPEPEPDSDGGDQPAPPPPAPDARTLQRTQTVSQRKLAEADLQPVQQPSATYQRRRGTTVTAEWTTEPGPANRRRDQANILTERSGLKSREARQIQTEVDAFGLFISADIVEKIVERTNKKLEKLRAEFVSKTDEPERSKSIHLLAPTDGIEMRAFFGLNILRGTVPLESARELFYGGFGPPQFRATMSLKRYTRLMTAVTLDDIDTRKERRKKDRFCLAREVFDAVDANLRHHYRPSEALTVDESLVKFRGRCSFKVYMQSKPGRYGILVRSMSDAYNRYMLKMWAYSGRPVLPDKAPSGVILSTVPALVKHLVGDYAKTGRNVTMDR